MKVVLSVGSVPLKVMVWAPVVATENGLSREQFLRAVAHKAGLPELVYAGGGFELSVFRDQSFSE